MLLENHFVNKSWGYERWFDNNELYCGKMLFVCFDKWSSNGKFHYHKKKTETFFILRGMLHLDYIDENRELKTIILSKDQAFKLEPLTKHRFTSPSDFGCTFIEVSTQHSDDDSYYDCPEND